MRMQVQARTRDAAAPRQTIRFAPPIAAPYESPRSKAAFTRVGQPRGGATLARRRYFGAAALLWRGGDCAFERAEALLVLLDDRREEQLQALRGERTENHALGQLHVHFLLPALPGLAHAEQQQHFLTGERDVAHVRVRAVHLRVVELHLRARRRLDATGLAGELLGDVVVVVVVVVVVTHCGTPSKHWFLHTSLTFG